MQVTVTADTTKWNTTGRGPHTSVAGFLFDKDGRFPILFRGPNVRSVKNCWSLPSGLHENGLTMPEQLAAEGLEELNVITRLETTHIYLGAYENIVHGEQWHWVVNMLALYPCDLSQLKNAEPEKHTEMTLARFKDGVVVRCDTGAPVTNWGPGLAEWLVHNGSEYPFQALRHNISNSIAPRSEDVDRPGVRSIAYKNS